MPKDTTTTGPSWAIASRDFAAFTPEENKAWNLIEEVYGLQQAKAAEFGRTTFFQKFGALRGRAEAGDKEALEQLKVHGTAESLENFLTSQSRAEWRGANATIAAQWPVIMAAATRIRSIAEKMGEDYLNRACSFHARLGVEQPSADAVTAKLDEIIEACRRVEAGPGLQIQLTEPPRPSGHFARIIVQVA